MHCKHPTGWQSLASPASIPTLIGIPKLLIGYLFPCEHGTLVHHTLFVNQLHNFLSRRHCVIREVRPAKFISHTDQGRTRGAWRNHNQGGSATQLPPEAVVEAGASCMPWSALRRGGQVTNSRLSSAQNTLTDATSARCGSCAAGAAQARCSPAGAPLGKRGGEPLTEATASCSPARRACLAPPPRLPPGCAPQCLLPLATAHTPAG